MNRDIIKSYNFHSETLKNLDKFCWWVQNVYQWPFKSRDLLDKLDIIAKKAETSEDNKTQLKIKVRHISNTTRDWRGKHQRNLDIYDHEIERKVLALFSELFVYDNLINNNFTDIAFIVESNKPTPDIMCKKDNSVYYVEVKRIQNPRDEDTALRTCGMFSNSVNINYREAVEKKIVDFINNAGRKFNSMSTLNNLGKHQKILVLDFCAGIDTILENKSNANLQDIFGKNFFDNLNSKYNMTIYTKKYLQ